jgi:quercetin dioxygenase-like cupin family protein
MIHKKISFLILVLWFAFSSNLLSGEGLTEKETPAQILEKMATSFGKDLTSPMFLLVNIEITDEVEGNWQIVVNGKEVKLNKIQEGQSHTPPQVTLSMSKETLDKINEGIWTATTARAQSKASDPTPINIRFAPGLSFAKLEEEMFFFMDHFFNWRQPETFELGLEHTRPAHGGNVIPLHYGRGFRSGWYAVKKGEKINAEGAKSPFPQLLIMLKGKAYVEINGKVSKYQTAQCLFIPPNSTHIIWNEDEEPALAIWMAWEY